MPAAPTPDALATLAAQRRGESVTPGDAQAALTSLDGALTAHQDAVYRMCFRVLGDPETAREAAQDAMLIAFERAHDYQGASSFRTWLLGIARYRSMGIARKRSEGLSDDGLLDPGDPQRPLLSQLRRHERETLIVEASKAVLDDLEQEAVYLRYVEGVSQSDITRILGLETASGGRGLLVRCRRKLKAEVQRRLDAMGHGLSFVRTAWA